MNVHAEETGHPVYLTVAEVAREWGVSKMTIYRLIHVGELGSYQIGQSYRLAREDVASYLRNHRPIPTQRDELENGTEN